MTNYTKTTDFAAKDSLPSGNAAKIVKGSEIDTEFNNIATASATKANANDAVLTGTTTAQTLDISGNVDVDGTLETDALSLNGVTVTSTAAELNYVDGVTSNIQTQLDTKAPLASPTFTGTVTVPGLTTTANVLFGDNDKAIFGAGSDLSIYSDGTQSIIQEDGPGALYIQGTHLNFNNAAGNASYITAVDGGAVTLFSGGSAKLATTSTGIDVTGSVTAEAPSGASRINVGTGSVAGDHGVNVVSGGANNDYGVFFNGSMALGSNTTAGTQLKIGSNGSETTFQTLTFHTNAGERMRVDSSGKVGIGTGGDTPTALLEVEAASNPEISIASSGGATSNFLNFKAISHSQQIQTQLKTVDNGDFTSDLAFLFKASGTSGALGEKARLTADGNLLVGTSSDTNTGKVRIQGATSSGGDSTVLTLHQGNFANGGASLIKIGTESGNFAKSAIGFKRTDDYDRGAIIFCQENTGDQSDVDSSDEVMRIDQTGKVGIGVTSMSHPLVIQNATPIIQLIDSNATTRVANIGGENGNVTIDIDPNQAEGTSYFSVDIDNTERIRVDASGNLLVGTTSSAITDEGFKVFNNGVLYGVVNNSQTNALWNKESYTSGTSYFMDFRLDNSVKGSISSNGTSTAFNTSSDQRLKENIADADDAGSKVDAIQVRQFDWIADGSHQKYGMVAQELQTVAPEAVTGDSDSDEMMGVDYSKLVPMLVKEIQSLRARVQQLENN